MTPDQLKILDHLDEERYEDVINAIDNLGDHARSHPRIFMAKGDAFYELGRDVDALEAYLECISKYPNASTASYAKFGAAMCLKNLHLQSEALRILETIDLDQPNRQDELNDSYERIAKQRAALHILARGNG
jgi:tetratricopeptide (TPR) repeat protein